MSGPALILEDVRKEFRAPDGGKLVVLDGLSESFPAGTATAIIGPSGSGKSTLLNIIGSLDRSSSGSVRLDSLVISSLTGPELARFRASQVGFVFQDHHLLPQLTAVENVLLPPLALGKTDEARDRAEELLERVGLSARRHAFPGHLSGGERQRVALARALVNRPGLLLCDEPTGNLDRDTGAEVVSLLLELARSQQATVLMVTHNLEQAARYERRLELRDGKLHPASGAGGEGQRS